MTEQLSAEEQEHLMSIFQSKNIIEGYFLPDVNNDAKYDEDVKKAGFMIGVSSLLEDPINLFIKGESGIGKTHIIMTVLKYFPQGNIMYLGGQSPTAFYHDNGILMNKEGKEIELDKEPQKPIRKVYKTDDEFEEAKQNYNNSVKAWNTQLKGSYTLVDLKHKIMFFLETPNEDVYTRLFPILSHDKEVIEFNFTDKTAKGNLKTRHIKVRGYPAAIFLMTERNMRRLEELSTRGFCVSPQISDEKFYEANKMTTLKDSRKWEEFHERPMKTQLKELLVSIESAFTEKNYDVLTPFENLAEIYPHVITRDMRDFTHFKQLIHTFTALHIHQRAIAKIEERKYVITSVQDVQLAFDVFKNVFETTRTNTEKAVLDFYWNYAFLCEDGFEAEELMNNYNEANPKHTYAKNTVYQKLNLLVKKGYLDRRKSEFGDGKIINFSRLKKKQEELVYNPLEHGNKPNLSAFLEEGLKSWLNVIPVKTEFCKLSNNAGDKKDFELISITMQEAEDIILCKNHP